MSKFGIYYILAAIYYLHTLNLCYGQQYKLHIQRDINATIYSQCSIVMEMIIGTPGRIYNMGLNFIDADIKLFIDKLPYRRMSEADPEHYGRQYYKPNLSLTFVDLEKTYINMVYGSGFMFSDIIQLPLITHRHTNDHLNQSRGKKYNKFLSTTTKYAPRFGFVLMTNLTEIYKFVLTTLPLDGFIGLGPEKNFQGVPSFIQTLRQFIKKAVVVFYLKKFNAVDPDQKKQRSFGVISIGNNYLPNNCDHHWFYRPVESNNLWMLTIDSVVLITNSSIMACNNSSVNNCSYVFAKNQSAFVNINDFMIGLPTSLMENLAKLLGARKHYIQVYEMPCEKIPVAPVISFKFINKSSNESMNVEFKGSEYIIPSMFGDCQLIFTDLGSKKTWMLGYSFFMKHCLQLDFGRCNMEECIKNNSSSTSQQRIGFASSISF